MTGRRDELKILRAVLFRMVTDAGGELVLGELTIDRDARNSVILELEAGLIKLTAIPDYVDIQDPEPVVAQGSGPYIPYVSPEPLKYTLKYTSDPVSVSPYYKPGGTINSGNLSTAVREEWTKKIMDLMMLEPLSMRK